MADNFSLLFGEERGTINPKVISQSETSLIIQLSSYQRLHAELKDAEGQGKTCCLRIEENGQKALLGLGWRPAYLIERLSKGDDFILTAYSLPSPVKDLMLAWLQDKT